ncbi:hypothetical protein X560_0346 [Listeria fleischmannii 1991]|uniref:Uncharacterized protein n=1 Tax=Listeria fleischmannii 1991 TaxID=1430899 RepID=A0A0J8J9D0_9LIST|nr:hypothetical protein X560_0346 [Listeria fleischmannii 1991]
MAKIGIRFNKASPIKTETTILITSGFSLSAFFILSPPFAAYFVQ